jgi:hypothetical protein
MRYLRCRCGRDEAWSSMGSPACEGCDVCHTTLASHPAEHRTPAPHLFRESKWHVDRRTGERWQERRCVRCHHRERIPAA